ncbi:MAG: TolC family outer membrane protein [Pseudomonadota bacterium]
MLKRTSLAALAMVAALFTAPSVQAQSLSDSLTGAYNTSGLLDQNRALLRAADEGVAQAVAATLPVLNWSINANRTGVTDPIRIGTNSALLRITADVVLYSGGANTLAIEAQKETVLATRQSLRNVEQDVLLRAVQAHMNLVRDFEFVQLRQNNVRLITQEFRAAQDRFDVGEVTRTDVALAEARLASARSLLAAAEGNLAISAEEYRIAVGVAPGRANAVSPATITRSLRDAQAFARQNHPRIREAQHTVSAAELNIRRAEASLRPSLSANAFITRDNEANESGQIGLTLGGPIYTGGLISSQIRQFTANRDAARSGLHLITLAIEQEVANAFSLLQVARASRQASDEQIIAARVAFQGVREEATLGSRTTLDVLNAEQELLDAQANLIAAQSDEVVASYSLLAAMGLLTADDLNLPVQQYDPVEYYNLVKNSPTFDSEQGKALDRVLEAIGQN